MKSRLLQRQINIKNIIIAVYYFAMVCLLVLPNYLYNVKQIREVLFSLPVILLGLFFCRKGFRNTVMIAVSLSLIFVFSFIVNSRFQSTQPISFLFTTYLCFFPFFMFDYATENDKYFVRAVIVLTSAVFIYVILRTMKELALNPFVARMLATGNNDDPYIKYLRNKNIGGFGFSYAVSMFIPYVSVKAATTKGKIRVLLFALLVALFIFGFYVQYTTLIILSFISCLLIFIIHSKNKIVKLALIIFGFAVLLEINPILKYLAYNLPFKSLADHFASIYMSLTEGEEATSRIKATKTCISMFLHHPFFGVDMTNSYNAYKLNHGHSTYFPMLASKGIFGTGLYAFALYQIMKSIIRKIGEYKAVLPVFITYIILGFLNPNQTSDISIAVFFIIPLIEFSLNRKKKEKVSRVKY